MQNICKVWELIRAIEDEHSVLCSRKTALFDFSQNHIERCSKSVKCYMGQVQFPLPSPPNTPPKKTTPKHFFSLGWQLVAGGFGVRTSNEIMRQIQV